MGIDVTLPLPQRVARLLKLPWEFVIHGIAWPNLSPWRWAFFVVTLILQGREMLDVCAVYWSHMPHAHEAVHHLIGMGLIFFVFTFGMLFALDRNS